MQPGAQIAAAIDLIALINQAWESGQRTPADATLSHYYKERRYIGSKDRAAISRLVYYILRNGAALEWWLEKAKTAPTPRLLVALAMVFLHNADLRYFDVNLTGANYNAPPLNAEEQRVVSLYMRKELLIGEMPTSVRYNFPDWMGKRLQARFGNDLPKAMEALNAEAPADLRINTLKTTRDDVLMLLKKEGLDPQRTTYSPVGVRLQKRTAIFTLEAFRKGYFEMQDEGSQLVAQLVQADPNDKVIDFCAGAGGKTLAIAAWMQNRGRILAWDTSELRLNQMPKRLARAGVSNVQLRTLASESDSFVKRHKETADWVLVDAPCTGSGTWRRSPDIKWRMTEKDLEELTALQKKILASAARLPKPGGRLVYATCSLFTEENEMQIEQFLAEHPDYRVAPIAESMPSLAEPGTPYLQLYPHTHDTDAFFAAVLERATAPRKKS